MSSDGQKWHRNIAENFNRLSRVHERYIRQTDRQTDRRQTDGRRHIATFTFAKNSTTVLMLCLIRQRVQPKEANSSPKLKDVKKHLQVMSSNSNVRVTKCSFGMASQASMHWWWTESLRNNTKDLAVCFNKKVGLSDNTVGFLCGWASVCCSELVFTHEKRQGHTGVELAQGHCAIVSKQDSNLRL